MQGPLCREEAHREHVEHGVAFTVLRPIAQHGVALGVPDLQVADDQQRSVDEHEAREDAR